MEHPSVWEGAVRRLGTRVSWLPLIALVAACTRSADLRLHYLPEFVEGTRGVLAPLAVGIAPAGGLASEARLRVGAIYDADGKLQRELDVAGVGPLLSSAIERALADGGAKPVVLDSAPIGNRPSAGADFVLACDLDQLEVNKRFDPQITVHGQVFTMQARMRLGCELISGSGQTVWKGESVGAEDEPPKPVGEEIFLPLETEPAESLSVALSRAVGGLLVDRGLRGALAKR